MKKQVILSSILITFLLMFGISGCTLATNQSVNNDEAIVTNTTNTSGNTIWYGTNSIPSNVEGIQNEFQKPTDKVQKDNKRAVTVTIVVMITAALIAALVGWYYMTNQ